jgi:hypothetical protein
VSPPGYDELLLSMPPWLAALITISGVLLFSATVLLFSRSRVKVTYSLGRSNGVDSIRCLICDQVSSNPNDVQNLYCGNCHVFHEGAPAALPDSNTDSPSGGPTAKEDG